MSSPKLDIEKPSKQLAKEFRMSDSDFERIRELAKIHTGISLSDHKKEMVYSRLAKRVRTLGLQNFSQYCDLISDHTDQEIGNFVNAITTNLTSFFRENHHFEYLSETIIPELKSRHQTDGRIRIWSAGCSTGEEPYSIAITLSEGLSASGSWDIKVLATDLDSNVLQHASDGIYERSKLSSMSDTRIRRSFEKGSKNNANYVHVKKKVRDLISFKQLNLMGPWPMKGPFDVIFCRNVVIYFDKPTQKKLFDRYAHTLADGGYLFIGHSENLHGLTQRFESLGRTIYRKIH